MINVITIWGWTWSYNLLTALKNIPNINLSCIVTMSDDGGSTWRIRDEYWVLPPGDLRRAIVALSDDEKTEILRKIFNHRFEWGSLDGHNLWNLIMMALEQITDNNWKAIDMLEELFDIKWKVYPSTFEKTRLLAKLENLDYVIWETNIDIPKHDPNIKIQDIYVVKEEYVSVLEKINSEKWISHHIIESIYEKFLQDKPSQNPEINSVIESADYIIFAPWDLYTSILPNILVGNISSVIANSNAKKLLFVNLFTKYWETTGFNLSNFIQTFEKYFNKDIFDTIFFQDWDKYSIDQSILDKYKDENKTLVKDDLNDSRLIKADFIKQNDMIRHDSQKIKDVLENFLSN